MVQLEVILSPSQLACNSSLQHACLVAKPRAFAQILAHLPSWGEGAEEGEGVPSQGEMWGGGQAESRGEVSSPPATPARASRPTASGELVWRWFGWRGGVELRLGLAGCHSLLPQVGGWSAAVGVGGEVRLTSSASEEGVGLQLRWRLDGGRRARRGLLLSRASLLRRSLSLELAPLSLCASLPEMRALVSLLTSLGENEPAGGREGREGKESERGWLCSSERGPLLGAHVRRFWSERFARRLLALRGGRGVGPLLAIHSELRLNMPSLACELRAEGGAYLKCFVNECKLRGSLKQRRSHASSLPSRHQLWAADALRADGELSLLASFLNRSLGEEEPLLEPWGVKVEVDKAHGEERCAVRVRGGEGSLNVSKPLLALGAELWGNGVSEVWVSEASESEGRLLLSNSCGLAVWVAPPSSGMLEWRELLPSPAGSELSLPLPPRDPSGWLLSLAFSGGKPSQLSLAEEATCALPCSASLQVQLSLTRPPPHTSVTLEELFVSLQPGEDLEVPFWALSRRGLLRLRRQEMAQYEGPVEVRSLLSSHNHPSPPEGEEASRACEIAGLRLFSLHLSAASLSQPSDGSHVSDVVLGFSWAARLHNLLPADVELQTSLLPPHAQPIDSHASSPTSRVEGVAAGEQAELPVNVDSLLSDWEGSLSIRARLCAPGEWRWTPPLQLRREGEGWSLWEEGEGEGREGVSVSLAGGCSARLAVERGEGAPRLVLWSPYWLINKTGLRLAYHLQGQQQLLEPTFDTGHNGQEGEMEKGLPSVPLMLACDAGEQLVVQARPPHDSSAASLKSNRASS
ncbi:MAG: hypothetical protein SGPRY_003428 [Prymnesium sp.]